MIQDLSDLAELGKLNKEKLVSVGMDLKLLEKARAESTQLLDLIGQVNSSSNQTSPAYELHNKAFYHLKEAVDEIRDAGQFAFRNNEERLKGYHSDYIRKMNQKKRKKKPGPGE